MMDSLRQSNAELADAANNPERFQVLFREMERNRSEEERQKQREIVSPDPAGVARWGDMADLGIWD